jgi:hypothetical protein
MLRDEIKKTSIYKNQDNLGESSKHELIFKTRNS